MTRWVEYAAAAARDRRHPDRAAARPRPLPHERYLWDTGGHFGEWLEPDVVPGDSRPGAPTTAIVATAYLARSAQLLSRIARLLGRAGDADRYGELAAAARDGLAAGVPGGRRDDRGRHPGQPRARARVRPRPDDLRSTTVADRLADAGLPRTGTSAPASCPPACCCPPSPTPGTSTWPTELLLSTGVPSWLAMIDRGATTIWEWWDGVADGRAQGSLNHYSKGAVISFLHTHVAGIRLSDDPGPDAAGYRRFVVEPRPGGGLTSASATHDCPYGRIESSWTLDDDRLHLQVTVPPGTRAEIRLPDGAHLPGRSRASPVHEHGARARRAGRKEARR